MAKRPSSLQVLRQAKVAQDPLQFYRAPLLRTMTGYKLLSGTFLMCGTLAVPALLVVGETAYSGAAAVFLASVLPMAAQTVFVPRYVARMTLVPNPTEKSTAPLDVLDRLVPQSEIKIDFFSFFGRIKTRIEKIGQLKPHKDFRWVNWKSTEAGTTYYVERQGAGPILKKILSMVDHPNNPEKWRTY